MNENPGKTPNPLNNNSEPMPSEDTLDANPSEPLQDVNEPEEIIESNAVEESESVVEEEPESNEEVTETVETPSKADESAETVEASSKTDESVETIEASSEADIKEKPKKSKKALVFAIIGCIFFLGAIAATVAAILLTQQKSDPVAAAMQKIMSGNTPKNIAIDGDINILINNSTSPIKRININLNSETAVGSMINTSSAVLNLTDQSNKDYSVKFEELYASEDNLYFKIDNATKLIEEDHFFDLFDSQSMTTNCIDDESGLTNCGNEVTDCMDADETDCVIIDEDYTDTGDFGAAFGQMQNLLVGIVEAADGKWVRISSDLLKQAKELSPVDTSSISCVTDLVQDTNKDSNSALEIYNKYPFIKSTDENVIISKKQNPIFQVSLDSKNFTEYLNAIQGTELARSLNKCMGWSNNAAVTEDDVNAIVQQMPNIYAEVNSDNDFTRLYLESEINDGAANMTIDLGFSYPSSVNPEEPVEYTNFEDLIQTLFSGLYENV